MKENTLAGVIAVALGALLSYCLQLFIPIVALAFVVIIDYVTGMTKAWVKGELSSKVGMKGIVKKLSYFVIVAVAGSVDLLIAYGMKSVGVDYKLPFMLAVVVVIWLIINELISILENVEQIGGPKVPFLSKLLSKLKKTAEDKGDAAAAVVTAGSQEEPPAHDDADAPEETE